MKSHTRLVIILISFTCLAAVAAPPPGVVLDTSPDFATVYVGCPSIAMLPNGDYVASHSWFGKGTPMNESVVFGSSDRGETWEKLADLDGQWWSTLFVHNDALYIFGVNARYGHVVIRRSDDGGRTWTNPTTPETGLLIGEGKFHCAPVPVVIHEGRIWRAFEEAIGKKGWPGHFGAFVMSASVDADLLNTANWTQSNRLLCDSGWVPTPGERPGWLEGNVVITPEDKLVNIMRVNDDRGDRASILTISEDGKTLAFDPAKGFIDFPGGRTKFTIRFDDTTQRYWSLVNPQIDPDAERNRLVLISSEDLRNWQRERTIIEHPDREHHGFQYVDWLFDGDDIIAVSRTAWDGAHNFHDANHLTFHRIPEFREE
jgi:hypothetical protein